VQHVAIFLALDCPSRVRRLQGVYRRRFAIGVPPTLDPPTAREGSAAIRKMAGDQAGQGWLQKAAQVKG
jgi:hypothetical protein